MVGRQGLPTIRSGSHGPSVTYCQNLLNNRTAPPPLWVDGIFGQRTNASVRQFQLRKRLVSDGIVGLLTWAALEAGPPPINKRMARRSSGADSGASGERGDPSGSTRGSESGGSSGERGDPTGPTY
jgi:peptidoglycan hydrolase-like protein with peptidoglycan-binding domain